MAEKKTIGETIRELRKEKGYTQEAFGSKIGYTKSTVSKIETGEISPTSENLMKMAKALGVDLSYLLRDTLQIVDYELAVVKSFIERFVRITTPSEYFKRNDSTVLNPDEFIFSLLNGAENSLILQMDKSLLGFIREIAEIENSKQELKKQEYENRISGALCKLHKSEPGEEITGYYLASIQDIENVIDAAVNKKVKGICAIKRALEKGKEEKADCST